MGWGKEGEKGRTWVWLGTPAMLRWAKEMSVQTSSHLGGWRGDRRAVTPELFGAGSQAVPWQMCFEEFWGAEIRITKSHSLEHSYTGSAQRGEEKMCQYAPYLWKVGRVSAARCSQVWGLLLTAARVAVLPLKSYSELSWQWKRIPFSCFVLGHNKLLLM